VTKPNPENCKNCSSKCAYDCAASVYNTTYTRIYTKKVQCGNFAMF